MEDLPKFEWPKDAEGRDILGYCGLCDLALTEDSGHVDVKDETLCMECATIASEEIQEMAADLLAMDRRDGLLSPD